MITANPTIDDMLAWLDRFDYTGGTIPEAIRAILEQHRDPLAFLKRNRRSPVFFAIARQAELEAIRAFVTRVGAKYTVEHPTVIVPEFMRPWWDELDAMEKG